MGRAKYQVICCREEYIDVSHVSERIRDLNFKEFNSRAKSKIINIFFCIPVGLRHENPTPESVYNVTIPENSLPKTQAISQEKMGIFVSDPTLAIRYKIVAGDTDRFFKAESRLVGDFWFLIIRVRTGNRAVLNREYQDTYRLTVRATVTSNLRRELKLKAQAEVIVTVTDTNDITPTFYPSSYEVSVPEDKPLHSSILQISAHDPDLGINGEIYYNLADPSLQFAVHPTRGVKFRATELASRPTTVTVKVTPVNLYPPEIFVRQFSTLLSPTDLTYTQLSESLTKISESMGELDALEIIDGDPSGVHHNVRAKDKGTPPRTTTQVVTVRLAETTDTTLTFEQADYDVEIEEISPPGSRVLHLKASAGQKRRTTAIVNVRVLDNNDNDPVFNSTVDSIVFDENKPAGSVVYTAYATDKDEGDNGYITYSLANLNPVPFTMDPFTGEIRATEILDYETMRREYILKVRAPLFEKVGCKGYVSQSAPINTEIITLSAIDFDYGSTVKYRMVPTNDDSCFRLEPTSGVLRITCDLAKMNIRERTVNVCHRWHSFR
ncbi:fat-like cadherin-related tumor suppressor homolog [Caerostris extrusa]|uniref:Fat-like cadherin-related tumor suppressor homolog n=1 Tax=Caerostris extrusa TaxID=172846 RepID=A0AAV4V6M0_CAEEX|nr:fat-like cadherin-related tumor suppressor homolog [Caerostris extrusa]